MSLLKLLQKQLTKKINYKDIDILLDWLEWGFVEFIKEGITAWGECAPGKTEGASTAHEVEVHLKRLIDSKIDSLSQYELYQRAKDLNVPACAMAGIDIALWDWSAKKANMSLKDLLGLPSPSVPTSLTVGINPPEVVKERVELILQNSQVRALKIKLGSKEGIEYDKLIYSQVIESTKNKDIAKLLKIDYWTTIVVYKDNKELAREIGLYNEEDIYKLIKKGIQS